MRKLIFSGGILVSIILVLIISDFSINPNYSESPIRSIEFTDSPSTQGIVLHQTEIGDQYLTPLKKSIPNSNWEESEIFLDAAVSNIDVEQNISFEFFSEMPTPSQKALDRYNEKSQNPTQRKIPMISTSTSEISPSSEGAINIDEYLDMEKKS